MGWVYGVLGLAPAGPPVSEAWVYWEGPLGAWAARTDAQGRFTLPVPPGTYRVWVEAEGLAASRVEGLEVYSGKQVVRLTALPPFQPSRPRVAPRIRGVYEGVAGDWVRFRGGVEAGEGLAALTLMVGLGQVPSSLSVGPVARFYLEEAADTGPRVLATSSLGGRTQLVWVGYDTNNNRAELRLPLDLPPAPRGQAPQNLRAVAFTVGRPLGLLAQGAGTSLFVRLSWSGGGEGYLNLWRRERGIWTLLAQLPPGAGEYLDLGPGLLAGEEICYRLEGALGTSAACTVPLPSLVLEVLQPQPGEALPPQPEFRWRIRGGQGVSFFFRPAVWDQLTGRGYFLSPTAMDRSSPPFPLIPGRPYVFELFQAYGVDDLESPRAYVIMADRQGVLSGFPLPGPTVAFSVEVP